MKNLIETLRNQAVEIAKEGHSGWGNTMSCAADAIEKLDAEGTRGRKAMEAMDEIRRIFDTCPSYDVNTFQDIDIILMRFENEYSGVTDEN